MCTKTERCKQLNTHDPLETVWPPMCFDLDVFFFQWGITVIEIMASKLTLLPSYCFWLFMNCLSSIFPVVQPIIFAHQWMETVWKMAERCVDLFQCGRIWWTNSMSCGYCLKRILVSICVLLLMEKKKTCSHKAVPMTNEISRHQCSQDCS